MKGYIHSIETMGLLDGPGIRIVVFMQGCPLRCLFCHNPDTWKMKTGETYDVDTVVNKAMRYKNYWGKDGGVTVSGGEALVQIEFVTEFDDKNSSVFADEAKFLAALVNIIKNAIEAIEEVGKISIKTSIKDDFISIIIENNGAKIPEEVQQKIFSDGFTTKSSGNGIGLYVCQKTLEEQFARLELLKSDDNSTEFEILVSMV